MRYISTRGGIRPISFSEAVMMGLARDGGLLLPETLPAIEPAKLAVWQSLSYQYLAVEILQLFIDDLARHTIEELVEKSYASFSHPQVTPVRKMGDLYILELFYGPTLAFKDVALQLLGNLFAHYLQESGSFMNIIGATSGDTGSAAIHGVRGKDRINIFILHPHQRTSPIQALQMTTVLDDNVFNIAVRGTFDHAQGVIKELFNDLEFRDRYRLGAVNSINWARVLAQVVYYVYSYLRLRRHGFDSVDFSVPTGNFGDIFAGYIAKAILQENCIHRLILATNENDILSRFVNSGVYETSGQVIPTFSPSMDIQIASNFERYLYYLHREDSARVRDDMARFADTGRIDLSQLLDTVQEEFAAVRVSEQETLDTIRDCARHHDYLLDPHTAVGVRAAQQLRQQRPVICLATAHPAKFGEAVQRATGREVELPPALAGLTTMERRCTVLDPDTSLIKDFIRTHALTGND